MLVAFVVLKLTKFVTLLATVPTKLLKTALAGCLKLIQFVTDAEFVAAVT